MERRLKRASVTYLCSSVWGFPCLLSHFNDKSITNKYTIPLVTCRLSSICFRLLSASFSESTGFFFAASSPLASLDVKIRFTNLTMVRNTHKIQVLKDRNKINSRQPFRSFQSSLYSYSSGGYTFLGNCRVYRWTFVLLFFMGVHGFNYKEKKLTNFVQELSKSYPTLIYVAALLPW